MTDKHLRAKGVLTPPLRKIKNPLTNVVNYAVCKMLVTESMAYYLF
jgi:hypothetical protein